MTKNIITLPKGEEPLRLTTRFWVEDREALDEDYFHGDWKHVPIETILDDLMYLRGNDAYTLDESGITIHRFGGSGEPEYKLVGQLINNNQQLTNFSNITKSTTIDDTFGCSRRYPEGHFGYYGSVSLATLDNVVIPAGDIRYWRTSQTLAAIVARHTLNNMFEEKELPTTYNSCSQYAALIANLVGKN